VRCSAKTDKARIRAFFLSRSALSLFFALFFLRAFALFFSFALASAKARKKRECPALDSHDRTKQDSTFRTLEESQDCKDWRAGDSTAGARKPGQDSYERTARTENRDRSARTEQLKKKSLTGPARTRQKRLVGISPLSFINICEGETLEMEIVFKLIQIM
jgi:hypothetical protein